LPREIPAVILGSQEGNDMLDFTKVGKCKGPPHAKPQKTKKPEKPEKIKPPKPLKQKKQLQQTD